MNQRDSLEHDKRIVPFTLCQPSVLLQANDQQRNNTQEVHFNWPTFPDNKHSTRSLYFTASITPNEYQNPIIEKSFAFLYCPVYIFKNTNLSYNCRNIDNNNWIAGFHITNTFISINIHWGCGKKKTIKYRHSLQEAHLLLPRQNK